MLFAFKMKTSSLTLERHASLGTLCLDSLSFYAWLCLLEISSSAPLNLPAEVGGLADISHNRFHVLVWLWLIHYIVNIFKTSHLFC